MTEGNDVKMITSKKLNDMTANLKDTHAVSSNLKQSTSAGVAFVNSRGRQVIEKTGNDEAWKDTLPAYNFKVRKGKKMELPQRDDSLIGGYGNLGASKMSLQSAKSYMAAKAAEDEKNDRKKTVEMQRTIHFMDC